jgi:signal transduction histidine kinase
MCPAILAERERFLRPIFAFLMLIVPAFVVYDIYFHWTTPTLDVTINKSTGLVIHVEQHSFADWAGLMPGDVILSVQGTPFSEWHPPSPGNYSMEVERRGRRFALELPVVPLVKINRISLISGVVTAIVFWAVGTILLWRRFRRPDVRLLFLLMQVLAVAALFLLAHPEDSRLPWMMHLGRTCFQLATPLLLHHAMTFPVFWGRPRRRRWLLTLAYALTLIAIVGTWMLEGVWVRLLLIITALELLAVGGFLVYIYTRLANPDDRRRLRLILFGNLAAGLPTIIFYILPHILHWTGGPPVWTASFLMVLSPFSYLFAIIRHRLFDIDRLLNRTLVYALLSLGILTLYLGLFLLIYRWAPDDLLAQILVASGLTLMVGLAFDWSKVRVQRLVDRAFYGGWYDYAGVVETISDALASSIEREQLIDVLTHQVPSLMQLRDAEFWIGEPDQIADLTAQEAYQSNLPAREVYRFTFRNQVRGLWVVGPHRNGDGFTTDDRRILETLARQAEVALGNVLLVETLQRQLDEIRDAQHQLLRSREEERSRLARDLHDGPIQLLVGLNLQVGLLLSQAESSWADEDTALLVEELQAIRVEVRRLLSNLRQVCSELRPPILDTLGLSAALRALADTWSAQHNLDVQLDLLPNTSLQSLSEEVSVNLYRVVQEALTNIVRHADAQQVTLQLSREDTRLILTIQDDGQGFVVPNVFQNLTQKGHFGLVGMQERVELIGGTLKVESVPGYGTNVRVIQDLDALAGLEQDEGLV